MFLQIKGFSSQTGNGIGMERVNSQYDLCNTLESDIDDSRWCSVRQAVTHRSFVTCGCHMQQQTEQERSDGPEKKPKGQSE